MWRGTGLRLFVPVAVVASIGATFLGSVQVYDTNLPRNSIPVLWGIFVPVTLLLGLVVMVVTSEFALRDRRDRIEETLATIPVSNVGYAFAKYLVVLGAALFLASVFLVTQLVVELVGHFLNPTDFPALWLGRYIRLWLLLPLPAVLFASALSLFGTFLLGNRRLMLFLLFFLIWLAPFYLSAGLRFSDITGQNYYIVSAHAYYAAIEHTYADNAIRLNGDIPPDQLPPGALIAPGSDVFSLSEVRSGLLNALNTWPNDLDVLVEAQLKYVAAAGVLVLLALWRFRRYQAEGAKS